MPVPRNSICDVPGISVGCAEDNIGKTGCTVILPDKPAIAGVDVRGSAPGTREIEAIKPVRLVPAIDAVLFTGGSAFGLDAAGGVQQFLEENGRGFDVGVTTVPIVPSAVIFDLFEGDAGIRPDKSMGYKAANLATRAQPAEGRHGAGRGATVGKALGPEFAMKGGQACASFQFDNVVVGALVVVNAFGNIFDPAQNAIIAGARRPQKAQFVDAEAEVWRQPAMNFSNRTNTTLAVIATNARLSKEEATKVAQMAQNGLARTIRPAHTIFDGDLIIALSVGDEPAPLIGIGAAAANIVAEAVIRAVKTANPE